MAKSPRHGYSLWRRPANGSVATYWVTSLMPYAASAVTLPYLLCSRTGPNRLNCYAAAKPVPAPSHREDAFASAAAYVHFILDGDDRRPREMLGDAVLAGTPDARQDLRRQQSVHVMHGVNVGRGYLVPGCAQPAQAAFHQAQHEARL